MGDLNSGIVRGMFVCSNSFTILHASLCSTFPGFLGASTL